VIPSSSIPDSDPLVLLMILSSSSSISLDNPLVLLGQKLEEEDQGKNSSRRRSREK